MSYTPPNTFTDGTVLTSAALEGNSDALRVYLHNGIATGDVENTQWIQTRHIQPPYYEPYTGVQHGVSGHQGGQWAGGVNIRLTFATKYTTGGGRDATSIFERLSNTSFDIEVRQPNSIILYHYWYEAEVGPDYTSGGGQVSTEEDRLVWIGPHLGKLDLVASSLASLQEAQNLQDAWNGTYPIGAVKSMPYTGGYASRDGTLLDFRPNVGTNTYGLIYHSQIDRVAVVNWGVAIEVYYL